MKMWTLGGVGKGDCSACHRRSYGIGEFEQALRVKGGVWGKNVSERAAQATNKMRESRHSKQS